MVIAGPSKSAGADPAASISPSTDLVDQQRVRVRASGFPIPPAENRISILQCAAEAIDVTGCGDFTVINVTTDDRGAASAWYRASRVLFTPAFGQVDCAQAVHRCVIVVASPNGSQIVAVPVSFDATVPPLPPVAIDARLASSVTLRPRTGTAVIRGSVTCTSPTTLRVIGSLHQRQGDVDVIGTIDTSTILRCTGTSRWSIKVRPDRPPARFREGTASAFVVLAVDRSGPRDNVELDADLPLVTTR
jgi:hypothetical protein